MYDSTQQPITLGAEVGHGGEAVVHQLVGKPDILAKIYTHQPRSGYDHKLQWMLAYPPEDPTRGQGHSSIAWPLDVLHNEQGHFVGYLMPHIQGAVSLLEVFNPRLRARKLPGFDLRYLYRTARNLAITIGAIHEQGYVVGDINESNILVTPSAMITIIDTDSFQVQEKESEGARLVVYPCPVGKPEYTSPELQGQSFQETIQKPEQDRFGLAILIFQLLMDGSHPFRAQWLAAGDPPPIEERIRQGCFPHIEQPSCPVRPPSTIVSLDTLHPKLAYLMRLCFVDGYRSPHQRPTPQHWSSALADGERALRDCPQGHYYGKHLPQCPYCQLKQRRQARPASQPTPRPATQHVPSFFPPTRIRTAAHVQVQPHRLLTPCPQCKTVNNSTEIYCQQCLHQLCPDKLCPFCQKNTPERAHFCTHCGYAL